ncbi:MAG: trypsin-like peptidase domain-containing protein [Silvanigrellaceae bacterium]
MRSTNPLGWLIGFATLTFLAVANGKAVQADSMSSVSPGSAPAVQPVAAEDLQTRADAGDPRSSYVLGMRYFLGDQVTRNRSLAKQYLTRAAESGDARAMNMLGLMSDPLWSDDATAKDLPTAVMWYRRAASQGYDAAHNNLTELKRRGYIKNELEFQPQIASGHGQMQTSPQPIPENSTPSVALSVTPVNPATPVNPVPPAQPSQSIGSGSQPGAQGSIGTVSGSSVFGVTPTSQAPTSLLQSALPPPMDGREIFKARSSSLVEIIGDGNYGSGVILGTLWNRPEDAILRTSLQDVQVNYPFLAPIPTPAATSSAGTAGESSTVDHAASSQEPTSLAPGSYLVIVSNAHVMEGTRRMEIGYGVDPRGQTMFKKPIAGVCFPTDNSVDLAIYFVPVEPSELTLNGVIGFAPMPVAATTPMAETGSKIFALANPERLTRTIAQGLLSGLRPDLIQFDAPISKGSSGGAVFDERGNLLGIIFGFLNEAGAQNINFAIPSDRIRPLMLGAGALCYRAASVDDAPPSAGDREKASQRIK